MKITAESIKAAEKVLSDNGIDEDEAQTVLQAVGYALAGVELYPGPEYGPLNWMADAEKARDSARDYVERVWTAQLREDDIESFCDYWVVGDKVRVSYEWRLSPDLAPKRSWREYPASIFESEDAAQSRAAEWRRDKDEADKAEAEARQREWEERARERDLAELKRLKEKYETDAKTAEKPASVTPRKEKQ